jgi:hypothetical protein
VAVLKGEMTKTSFEYIIRVDGQEVWRGSEPTEELFDKIRKKTPSKEVGISMQNTVS